MQFPVLIETTSDGRFRATAGEPLSLTVEAATREEVLSKLRGLVQQSLAGGKELVSLPIDSSSPGLPLGAGMFADDPLFDEWQEAIAEYRRKKDEEEGIE